MTEKITKKLYNDQVEIVFFPKAHRYKRTDSKKWITSVSAISGVIDKSRVLLAWASKLATERVEELTKLTKSDVIDAIYSYKQKTEEACSIGSQVHDFAERYAINKMSLEDNLVEMPTDENAINGCIAFIEWVEKNNVIFLETERLVYSEKYNYVGTFDALIKIKDKTYLIDYKTSKAFYPVEMRMQTAGYQLAYQEEAGEKIDGRMIIRFDKETGEFDVHELDNNNEYEQDKQAFLSALFLKEYTKSTKS